MLPYANLSTWEEQQQRKQDRNQFPLAHPRCSISEVESNEISLLLIKLFHEVSAAHIPHPRPHPHPYPLRS